MPQTFGGYPLYGADMVLENRRHFRRAFLPQVVRANCLYVPAGRWPAQGWLLMRRADFLNLNTAAAQSLVVNDGVHGNVTFNGLYVVQARSVTEGVPDDKDAVLLVQVTDSRGLYFNPWYQLGTTSQYNVIAPAYPNEYYELTMDGAAAFKWTRMVRDLWLQMPLLGSYPGLPVSPNSTPENWSFPGLPVWLALNEVLDQLGCVVSANLSAASQYGIIAAGSADATFTAFENANVAEDEYPFIDSGAGRAPGTLVVYFHRRNRYYGTEETVARTTGQWQTSELYSVSVTATAAGFPSFNSNPGVGFLWSDYTVEFDENNSPIASSLAGAVTIAVDQAASYYALIQRGTSGMMDRTYTGAQALGTSGQIDGVRWYQHGNMGWRMQVIRGFLWDEVQFNTRALGISDGE